MDFDNVPECLDSLRADLLTQLTLRKGAVGIIEVAEHPDVLGVIGHGQEIERLRPLHRLALEVDGLALGETVRLFRSDTAGEHDIGIKRIAGMQMEVAEIRLAVRFVGPP